MVLSNLLKSAAGTCPFCNQKAGILSREHPECRRAHQAGWQEMVQLAAQAAGSPDFDESHLRLTLSAVAKISYGNEDTVNQALEEGWKLGIAGWPLRRTPSSPRCKPPGVLDLNGSEAMTRASAWRRIQLAVYSPPYLEPLWSVEDSWEIFRIIAVL